MKHKILSILLVAILFFVTATPALASSEGGKGKVNPNSQVGRYETFQTITSQNLAGKDIVFALASGCLTYTVGVNAYSLVGARIYSYAWNIRWCYNGSTITSVSKWRSVFTNYGWSFKGDVYEAQSGGVGSSSYWHYAQGDFCFIETYTCVTHAYPWIDQTVYGNGQYTGSAYNGIY